MSSTVTVTWVNPDKNWQIEQVTVGDGESHFEIENVGVYSRSQAERYANWIKAKLDLHNRKPGTDVKSIELEVEWPGNLIGEAVQGPQFEPNETIRFISFGATGENRYLFTYEVLE